MVSRFSRLAFESQSLSLMGKYIIICRPSGEMLPIRLSQCVPYPRVSGGTRISKTPMKRWVDYLTSTSKDHLVDWSLGDWLEIGPGLR